jgi:hypothetical protein
MHPALAQVLERLKQMSPERQEAFARLIMREIVADEQWQRSAAQAAEWQRKQKQQGPAESARVQAKPKATEQRANEVVPFT